MHSLVLIVMILSTGNLREPRFGHPWYTHLYSTLNNMTPRTGSLPITRPLPSPENPGKSEYK